MRHQSTPAAKTEAQSTPLPQKSPNLIMLFFLPKELTKTIMRFLTSDEIRTLEEETITHQARALSKAIFQKELSEHDTILIKQIITDCLNVPINSYPEQTTERLNQHDDEDTLEDMLTLFSEPTEARRPRTTADGSALLRPPLFKSIDLIRFLTVVLHHTVNSSGNEVPGVPYMSLLPILFRATMYGETYSLMKNPLSLYKLLEHTRKLAGEEHSEDISTLYEFAGNDAFCRHTNIDSVIDGLITQSENKERLDLTTIQKSPHRATDQAMFRLFSDCQAESQETLSGAAAETESSTAAAAASFN